MADLGDSGGASRQISFRIPATDHENLRIMLYKMRSNYRDYFMGLHNAFLRKPSNVRSLNTDLEKTEQEALPLQTRMEPQPIGKWHLSQSQREFLARSMVTYGFGLMAMGIWQVSVDAPKIPHWAAIACVMSGLCLQALALLVVRD